MQPNKLKSQNAKTLEKYYGSINVGDFMGALETLSPDVVFSIPGDSSILPFSGEWVGKESVMKLFQNFIDAFYIVHMDETCTITSENELISFNDESFKVKSTGQYYRVGVVHHMKFDENGLITSLINMHDTTAAVQAFSGNAAIVQPILSAAAVESKVQLSDIEAAVFVQHFYAERVWESGEVADFLDESVTLIAPGNPDKLPFSGVWIGKDNVLEFIDIHKKGLNNRTIAISSIIANNDTIAVVLEESGTNPDSGELVTLKRYDLIQLAEINKIGSITIYVDTYPFTV